MTFIEVILYVGIFSLIVSLSIVFIFTFGLPAEDEYRNMLLNREVYFLIEKIKMYVKDAHMDTQLCSVDIGLEVHDKDLFITDSVSTFRINSTNIHVESISSECHQYMYGKTLHISVRTNGEIHNLLISKYQ
jgi:hypothetical protein